LIPIFVSLILIGLFVFLYSKERKTPGYKAPTVFRIIVMILLILIVFGNIFKFSYHQSAKVPLLILVDASKSINIGDNLAKIKEVINKIDKEPFGKKTYSFSDSIGPLDNYQKALGKRTDISEALSFAQKNRPGAVVLISDGQHNLNNDPTIIAQRIQAPIYTVGLGAEQKQNVAIKSIRKPIRSFLGDSIDITARVQSRGLENQKTKVNLEHNGKTTASKDILLSGKDAIQEINFKTLPETTGKINYTIRIDNLPNEATYANNRRDFSVEVLKNRWQVLYITNSPSFNTRFIISNLETRNGNEANFTVIPMVAFAGRDLEILKDMPVDKAFQNSDVVILDDINEDNLNTNIITNLRNLIDQHKGLLILSGENFRPIFFLREISPFEFATTTVSKKDVFLELTEAGAATPIFFNEQGEYLLDNVPPLWGFNFAANVKPEAVIWATTKDDKRPLIGFRPYKNSKVVVMSGFPLWRLGFSSVETERTKQKFNVFLKNLMRFLAIKEFEPFKLITDKPDYLVGEDIIFNLLATTPDGRNWTDLDIRVEIPSMNPAPIPQRNSNQTEIGPNASKVQKNRGGVKVALPLYESNPGTYESNIEAMLPGEYQAKALVSKDNKLIGKTKTTFSVTQQTIEDITGLNSDLLMKLSNITNGRYYTAIQFLNESFTPTVIKYKKNISFTFHNNSYIYIIITILFGILLFLRKKRGFL